MSKKLRVLKKWEKWAKGVKRREAAFKKMTKAQQRVAIAKDVLAQLDAKLIKAQSGRYLSNRKVEVASESIDGIDVRDLIMSAPQCSVCAIGAIFTSTVVRTDKLKTSRRWMGDDFMLEYLSPYFDERQLRLMEVVFERGQREGYDLDQSPIDSSWAELRAGTGAHYGKKAPRIDDKVLRAIMGNVIRNRGRFKPNQAVR